jgi:hypothetical protein
MERIGAIRNKVRDPAAMDAGEAGPAEAIGAGEATAGEAGPIETDPGGAGAGEPVVVGLGVGCPRGAGESRGDELGGELLPGCFLFDARSVRYGVDATGSTHTLPSLRCYNWAGPRLFSLIVLRFWEVSKRF